MCGATNFEKQPETFRNNENREGSSLFSRSKKILIVEDNPINRQILTKILGDHYDVIEAENGKVALEQLERYSEEIILILLDIIMPVMDGYTFLSIIKENPTYATIPVIVTTANDSEEDEVKTLSLGATDFIRKPYRPQIVKHRVESIVNLYETAAMVNLMKYDQLTGVFSKEYFFRRAEEVVRENPDQKYDIICSDIENFSLINDMFGHEVGNDLLRHTADVLNELVLDRGMCGRMNADTFAILLQRQEYSADWFDPYIDELNKRFTLSRIHLDFGIYQIEMPFDTTINAACDRAMSAIETIKGQIDRNFAFYDDTIRQEKLHAQAITDSMEKALEEKQFVLYYQPKYSLKDESIVGAEALVRWISPEEGLMMPGQFIPLFEQNGFITQLDKYVWEEACILIRKCIDAGIPIVPISVNVSRADLYNPNLPEIILGLVKKYNLEPKQLHLEVTESAYTEHPEVIIDSVSKLREAGFIIEMDDFGTGYSSLNMLSELPIDILKLDMKFVQNNTTGDDEKTIINFVIDLAKWMNLTITAEGTETREQVERLKMMNCDATQGYYFARPMPESDFIDMLVKEAAKKQNNDSDKEGNN